MQTHAQSRPGAAGAPPGPPSTPADEDRRQAIARAVRTEIHWLMPPDRTVTIAIDGDDIAVAFGPPSGGRP